jgi:hypothetical protein
VQRGETPLSSHETFGLEAGSCSTQSSLLGLDFIPQDDNSQQSAGFIVMSQAATHEPKNKEWERALMLYQAALSMI